MSFMVIKSRSELGFWSNSWGWVAAAAEATTFSRADSQVFGLPESSGGDASWVDAFPAPEFVDASVKYVVGERVIAFDENRSPKFGFISSILTEDNLVVEIDDKVTIILDDELSHRETTIREIWDASKLFYANALQCEVA